MTHVRMRFNDFTAMYQGPFNDLYHSLLGTGARTEGPDNAVIGFDVDRLKEAFRKRFDEFVRLDPTLILGPTELPAEAPSAPVKPATASDLFTKLHEAEKAEL